MDDGIPKIKVSQNSLPLMLAINTDPLIGAVS
jgi:hypothetical protein